MIAHIRLVDAGFMAELDDGCHIECADLRDLARELHTAGVTVDSVICGDWRKGDSVLMAGQQIALRVELRRLADDEQQAVRARCEALGLSFAHVQRLAVATDHEEPQAILWGWDWTLRPWHH